MANTAEENKLAQAAYRAIAARYAPYFHMNASITAFSQALVLGVGIDNYVKFVNAPAFVLARGIQKSSTSCRVVGFCRDVPGNKYQREMYINREFADSSTVVHEMLHFLTHPLFWTYVRGPLTEAVTEYFTRKVISKANDDKFDVADRKGHYDLNHQYLELGRASAKKKPQKGYMKAAYFQGDITALGYVQENFKEIEEMLAADSASATSGT